MRHADVTVGCGRMVVAGIGSPVLSDGAAGLHVIEMARLAGTVGGCVDFKKLPAGGIDLLGELEGYAKGVVVVSFSDSTLPPGYITETVVGKESLPDEVPCCLPGGHGVDLATLLTMGVQLGYRMPSRVVVFGINGLNGTVVGEIPADEVRHACKIVVEKIGELITQWET